MPSTAPTIRSISDTALWVAAIRAAESERRRPLFRDPLAARLAGERGVEILGRMRHSAITGGVRLRTVAIDRMVASAVTERGCDTVVSLGAGLDARAYRLDLPRELRWIEVDLPRVLEYKGAMLADDEPRCALESVRLDLADRSARRGLFAHVASTAQRALVLTEGLIGYLGPEAVADLATDLAEQAAFAEWMTDITGAQIPASIKNAHSQERSDDARSRFAPAENTAFFEPYGWREAEYRDLFLDARELGGESLSGKVLRTAVLPLLPRSRREFFLRGLGVVRLERTDASLP